MNQNTVNFSFAKFCLFLHYLHKIQEGDGKVSILFRKFICIYLNICDTSLLIFLKIQFSESRLFMYNKIFFDNFFLGKKTTYANNVQTESIRRMINSLYSDSSFH